MARRITYNLMIAWDGTNYVDESAYLISANGDMSYMPPGEGFTSGRGIISNMTITLDNASGRFSPFNTGSAIYSNIQNGKAYHRPCYLEVSIDNGSTFDRVFTGIIKYPEMVGATIREPSKVIIDCRSNEEKLLQKHTSTTLADFASYHTTGYSDGELIEAWLTDAGIDAGNMDIDQGIITISWAWLDDESIIEEIWRLAAACGGRFYANPDGVYRYENFTSWARQTESLNTQATFTPDSFTTFEPIYNDRDLFNSVLVEAAPREPVAIDILWQPDELVSIPASGTKKITARLRQPAYTITAINYSAKTSGGSDITSDVTITATKYAQRVEMSIENANVSNAAYIYPLSIVGQAVSGSITIEEERNAADHGTNDAFFVARGDRRKSIRGNVYIQNRVHAAMIAEFLMRQSEIVRPIYKLSGCPGDPSLRLGWKISIEDDSILSSAVSGLITSIRWRLSESGFSQDIESVDTTSLFAYADYFIVGTSKLGSSGTGIGRLFY